MAGADLLHLDPYPEFFGVDLDELAEIHPAVRYVIENGLCPVSLELHVTYLHVQVQLLGNLAGTDHRLLLPGYGLLPLVYVKRLGFAVDPPELRRIRIKAAALYLLDHHRAFERDDSEVVAALGFNDDQIAHPNALPRLISVDSLAGVLETDLKEVGIFALLNASEPVVSL